MLNTLIRTPRFLLAAVVMAVAGLGAAPAAAKADDFAMITIDNPTDSTVYYAFRWGNDGDWKPVALAPHHYTNHWYPLDWAGRAPTPYIRFDDGFSTTESYRLEFYASRTKGYYQGKLYEFEVLGSKSYGLYLDLTAK